jgi:hypothetical protein
MKNKIITLITLAFAITTSLSAAEDVNATNSPSATVTNIAGPYKNGDALNAKDAPQLANHALLVSAEIEPADTNGVIIAQGAGGNGYALYLKDGKPAFAIAARPN